MNTLDKVRQIRVALHNVPEVGGVYDQQHSDTQVAAVILTQELEEDIRRLAKALQGMVDTFDPVDPTRKQARVWDNATLLLRKLETPAK